MSSQIFYDAQARHQKFLWFHYSTVTKAIRGTKQKRDLVSNELFVSLDVELVTQPTVLNHPLTTLLCLYILLAIILSPLG